MARVMVICFAFFPERMVISTVVHSLPRRRAISSSIPSCVVTITPATLTILSFGRIPAFSAGLWSITSVTRIDHVASISITTPIPAILPSSD